MRRPMRTSIIAIAAGLLSWPAAADTLVSNINGIQVGADGKLQHFRALTIGDDGKVRQVLEHPELVRLAHITSHLDGGGRTLLPGLIDAHGHVMGLGQSALQLDLVGTTSLGDLQQRLRSYAATRNDRWLMGRGWNQELWSEKRFPTASDLDAAVADRPVMLERVDGHAIVVNGAALKAAGITSATKDPVGGKIERNADGSPTGLLVDAATELVGKVVPSPTNARRDEALAKAQETLLSVGVTATADMGTDVDSWAAMRRAGKGHRLKVRIMSYGMGLDSAKAISPKGPSPWFFSDRLKMEGVKFFDDGALGSRGAWLKKPYADKPDTSGLRFHTDAEYRAMVSAAAARGYQIATHAIGDAANAQVINTYIALGAVKGDRRWRIEHAQILDPKDLPGIGLNRIIASMQPTHQTSDRLMAEKRLGQKRLAGAYAWQSMLENNAKLAFGSDYPVESPNPFPGLAAAISRQDIKGEPAGGWIPSERLSFPQALHAFTRGAAYAGFAEQKIGALEPGKWADFILIDRDPTKGDAQSLARTQVLETWVAGKKVWSSASAAQPAK